MLPPFAIEPVWFHLRYRGACRVLDTYPRNAFWDGPPPARTITHALPTRWRAPSSGRPHHHLCAGNSLARRFPRRIPTHRTDLRCFICCACGRRTEPARTLTPPQLQYLPRNTARHLFSCMGSIGGRTEPAWTLPPPGFVRTCAHTVGGLFACSTRPPPHADSSSPSWRYLCSASIAFLWTSLTSIPTFLDTDGAGVTMCVLHYDIFHRSVWMPVRADDDVGRPHPHPHLLVSSVTGTNPTGDRFAGCLVATPPTTRFGW